jgi:hypothetical protein
MASPSGTARKEVPKIVIVSDEEPPIPGLSHVHVRLKRCDADGKLRVCYLDGVTDTSPEKRWNVFFYDEEDLLKGSVGDWMLCKGQKEQVVEWAKEQLPTTSYAGRQIKDVRIKEDSIDIECTPSDAYQAKQQAKAIFAAAYKKAQEAVNDMKLPEELKQSLIKEQTLANLKQAVSGKQSDSP